MCCFSVRTPAGLIGRLLQKPVHVSGTNIFARMTAPGVQALAYGMTLSTREPVAMILPLPVAPGSGEDAVRFIDLHDHANMFVELGWLFEEVSRAKGRSLALMPRGRLKVHTVGSFIASYVPTRADFTRLDERFRMPDVLFDAVPAYRDYAFAVFQLSPGATTVHPMAFTFPTRTPDRLYFPTVHLHDGRWHRTAAFDHALYYQGRAIDGDAVAPKTPRKDYAQLVDVAQPMIRRTLRGKLANADTWIG